MPPKGSPKGSPKGKGSPKDKGSPKGKGSPKKGKEEAGPPVEVDLQTTPNFMCLYCSRIFKNDASLQSHLFCMDHSIPEAPIVQLCKVCKSMVSIKDCEYHKCCIYKAHFLDQILACQSVKNGPPNICLLCRGRQLPSRLHLAVHLLCYHSLKKVEGYCAECKFEYTEIPPQENLEDLPEYNEEMDKHVDDSHIHGHYVLSKYIQSKDTLLRYPYGCPFCGFISQTNAEFHAHIIHYHGTLERYDPLLSVCLTCKNMFKNSHLLNTHIKSGHSDKYKRLAIKLSKEAHYSKFVDLLHTCTACWAVFEFDFQLQAHIVVVHNSMNPWTCGLCLKNFLYMVDVPTIYKFLRKHEAGHAYELHQKALEAKTTEELLPEKHPEDIVTDEEEEPEVVEKGKGKKGSPDKKKSPDKKGSPPKKGSPDKKGKASPPKGKK